VTGPGHAAPELYEWVFSARRQNRVLWIGNALLAVGSTAMLLDRLAHGDAVGVVWFGALAAAGVYGCLRASRHNRELAELYERRTGVAFPARAWPGVGPRT